MPRNYKRVRPVQYTEEHFKRVVELRQTGKGIREISKRTGVARETVRRWINGAPARIGSGKKPILTKEEEDQIAAALKYAADYGSPLKREDLKIMVQTYVNVQKLKTPFKNGRPGSDFCRSFEKRHPELGAQVPELVTIQRNKGLTEPNLNAFFEMYEDVLSKNHLEDQPDRIFNLDETGLNGNPIKGKVYVEKGKQAVVLNPNCGKTSYSVMFCVSASGQYLPPFVIYKAAHLYDSWTKGGPKDTVYTATQSGWMQDKNFEKWMANVFVKHVENLPKPVLLMCDVALSQHLHEKSDSVACSTATHKPCSTTVRRWRISQPQSYLERCS